MFCSKHNANARTERSTLHSPSNYGRIRCTSHITVHLATPCLILTSVDNRLARSVWSPAQPVLQTADVSYQLLSRPVVKVRRHHRPLVNDNRPQNKRTAIHGDFSCYHTRGDFWEGLNGFQVRLPLTAPPGREGSIFITLSDMARSERNNDLEKN